MGGVGKQRLVGLWLLAILRKACCLDPFLLPHHFLLISSDTETKNWLYVAVAQGGARGTAAPCALPYTESIMVTRLS